MMNKKILFKEALILITLNNVIVPQLRQEIQYVQMSYFNVTLQHKCIDSRT